jgi:hypothetical protein
MYSWGDTMQDDGEVVEEDDGRDECNQPLVDGIRRAGSVHRPQSYETKGRRDRSFKSDSPVPTRPFGRKSVREVKKYCKRPS